MKGGKAIGLLAIGGAILVAISVLKRPGGGGDEPPGDDGGPSTISVKPVSSAVHVPLGSHAGAGISSKPYPAWIDSRWLFSWDVTHKGPAGRFGAFWVTGAASGTFGGGDVEDTGNIHEQGRAHFHRRWVDFLDNPVDTLYQVQAHIVLTRADWMKRVDGPIEQEMNDGMKLDVAFFMAPWDIVDPYQALNGRLGGPRRDNDVFVFTEDRHSLSVERNTSVIHDEEGGFQPEI